MLAVSFSNGFIYLLKSYDDVSPIHINTEMNGSIGFMLEWSNAQELLAVAGTIKQKLPAHDAHDANAICYENVVKFYTECGYHLYTARIPSTSSPVSAMTWGHSDKRLFIATGTQVHIAWVSRKVAALQLLCRLQVQACIGSETMVPQLPLPARIKSLIANMYSQTIRVSVGSVVVVLSSLSSGEQTNPFFVSAVLRAEFQIAARVRFAAARLVDPPALHNDPA